ncbi:hypothetical protein [Chlorogloeopsis sp. ULAP02]
MLVVEKALLGVDTVADIKNDRPLQKKRSHYSNVETSISMRGLS